MEVILAQVFVKSFSEIYISIQYLDKDDEQVD
jgi:hypothetical protein